MKVRRKSKRPGGLREMLTISLPMVVSHGCETAMTFTDRLFLSVLGPLPMNAAMIGGLTSFMLMTFFIGLIGYVTALVAQYLGSGKRDRCALVLTQAVLLALFAYPVILALRPLAHLLFEGMGSPLEQLHLQQLYFDILVYGSILVLLKTAFSSFFSGIGRTRVVMLAALTTMSVNMAVNYVLIFGHLGFPALGLRGAAYGTLTGSLCGFLVLIARYLRGKNRRDFKIADSIYFERGVMLKLLRFGSPAGLEMFLNILAFTLLILLFHSAGPVTATAVTIVFNWDMVSFVPLLGIQIGVVSLVGRYLGAGKPDTAARATRSGLKMAWCYSSFILVIFVAVPDLLVGVFQPRVPDSLYLQAYPLAVSMLRLAALYVLADATIVVFSGTLRGAGDTFWTMCMSVLMHWLLVLLLFVLLKLLALPPLHAWLAVILFFLLAGVAFYARYRSGRWKNIDLVRADGA